MAVTDKPAMKEWKWSQEKDQLPWKTPDGLVMGLIYTLGQDPTKKIFDLGCGLGRHTVFFAAQGYHVFASDPSEEAVRHTQEWLRDEGLSAEVFHGSIIDCRHPRNFFDLVVAFNTIFHAAKEDIVQTFTEVHRILKPGGLFYGTLRIKEPGAGFQKKNIEVINDHLCIEKGGPEDGIPHYFLYVEELPDLFQDFDMEKGSLVYVKLYEPPFTAENLKKQLGGEFLRFWAKKPQTPQS